MTVGDIRKAIEGLPDDAEVSHSEHYTEFGADDMILEVTGFAQINGRLIVAIDIDELDPFDDEDDEDDFADDE